MKREKTWYLFLAIMALLMELSVLFLHPYNDYQYGSIRTYSTAVVMGLSPIFVSLIRPYVLGKREK